MEAGERWYLLGGCTERPQSKGPAGIDVHGRC